MLLRSPWRPLILVLVFLGLGALAYGLHFPISIDVGALGDRAFLWASPLGADTGWNGDEHLAAERVSYRWSKRVSWLRLRDIAWSGPVTVTLRLRSIRPTGEPLPEVEVRVNGVTVGRFRPTGAWETRSFSLREIPDATTDLEVLVQTAPFVSG
ncbi:MAG: hypothetical protein ACP5SI_08085, partial [Chloroflexia bacterium]